MKYQELKIGETYLYNNKEYKVLYKHDETQSVFTFNVVTGVACAWAVYEFKGFKPKVKTLPKTGLLVYGKADVLIYRAGKESGYGFYGDGGFDNSNGWTFESHPEEWREATKEDYKRFKELVIRHLKSLCFKDGDFFYSLFTGGRYIIDFDANLTFDEGGLYLGGSYVYYNNKWIQPISAQNKLKKEIETRIKELEQTIQQLKKDIKE